MATRLRRALPDNLDPLVDTLANVVGILVIVIVLTQIELGDALDRLTRLGAERSQAARAHEESLPLARASLEARTTALRARTEADPEASSELARRVLADLEALPERDREMDDESAGSLRREVAAAREALASADANTEERERYATRLQQVPSRMVARLPEPQVLRGRESWVLVRYGRVYPIDRERLVEDGSKAIQRILPDGQARRVRTDEFESAAHYLRKHPIGAGNLRWQLQTDPPIRAELEWVSREGGIDRFRLPVDPRWRAWLQARTPDQDLIRFHVWSDSFETYLAARQAIEKAGFRAGWKGYAADEEIELGLKFGQPLPRERAIRVD